MLTRDMFWNPLRGAASQYPIAIAINRGTIISTIAIFARIMTFWILHMKTDLRWALAFVVLLVGCSTPPAGPEAGKALVEQAAASMGGWTALEGIKTQEIVSGGADWEPLQSLAPDAPPRQMNTFTQTTLVDYEKKQLRVTFDAVRVYPSTQPVKFVEVMDAQAGMLTSPDANNKIVTERLHPSRHATRLRDFNRLPLRILYTAKNAPDLRREADRPGGKVKIEVLKFTDSGLPVELQFDQFDQLPLRVIYTEDDPVEGDSLNEVLFTDWKEVDGVRLPQTITTLINGKKIREERVQKISNNKKVDGSSFAIPPEIRAEPENGERIVSQWTLRRAINGVAYADFGRRQNVEFVSVAPGFFHITGGSHNSAVMEMKDSLVVIEMPLFEERSVAVLAALRDKFPGKPVKYGVMTHYHMDHSGGMRAYAAKGATLLAHESIVPWIKEMLKRPKTIRPDSLANLGVTDPAVEGVGSVKVISDGERTIEFRHVPNGHASGMLVAYLPKEKVLFVSDLYSPGNPVAPGDQAANAYSLHAFLMNAHISVDRIVGGHGGIGPIRDLEKLMAAVPKPN